MGISFIGGTRGSQANGDDLPFPMDWFGRKTCEKTNADSDCVENDCSAKRGPHRDLPSPHLDTHKMLSFSMKHPASKCHGKLSQSWELTPWAL